MELQTTFIQQSFDFRYSASVREALGELPDCFTVTDPCISGHPIVFASCAFLKMVGYSIHEVIGKNGRMFQGPKTNRRSVMEIREAIREEKAFQVTLLNYRKDGTPFWMLFHVCPVFSKEDGRVIHFVGVQVPLLGRVRPKCRTIGNGVNFSEGRAGHCETLYNCCRREVRSDSIKNFGHELALESAPHSNDREIEFDEPEATELERRAAASAISNILSVLTHYSELTGRIVCEKRCFLSGDSQLGASLYISLGRIKQSFVLTDAQLPDSPIIYASEAFLNLTGYARDEVLGRNCRFLSGLDTDTVAQDQIKDCMQTKQPCTVRILNYRKNGTSFWNYLHISPVRNASGKVAYFVGVQVDDCGSSQGSSRLRPDTRQLSVVAAVKVAVRSSSMSSSMSS